MTKVALFMLAVEVLAACVLIHRIVKVVRDGIAVHRAKQSERSNQTR